LAAAAALVCSAGLIYLRSTSFVRAGAANF